MVWRPCDTPIDELLDGDVLPIHAKSGGMLKALAAGGKFWRHANGADLALHRPEKDTLVTWRPLLSVAGLPAFGRLDAPGAPPGWREKGRSVRQTLRIDGDWEEDLSQQLRRHLRKGEVLPTRLVWFHRSAEDDGVMLRAVQKFQTLRPPTFNHRQHLCDLLDLPPRRVRTGVLEVGPHRAFFVLCEFADTVCASAHFTFVAPGASLNLTTLLHGALIRWARSRGVTHYHLGMHHHTSLTDYQGVSAYKSLWRGELHPTISWLREEG